MNPPSVHVGIPLVRAAVTRWAGQLGGHVPGYVCRAWVFPESPVPVTYPSSAELGVVGAAAVMGSREVDEALKTLLGVGDSLAGSYQYAFPKIATSVAGLPV